AAAAGCDLANGTVCVNVAAIRYPPSSAATVPPAISPILRPDHEPLGPPEAAWGGGQDCPGAGPAGGQDCGGGPAGGQDCGAAPAGGQDCGPGDGSGWAGGGCGGSQNWPGGRDGACWVAGQDSAFGPGGADCPAGGRDCAPGAWSTVAAATAVYGRTWYPRAWAYSVTTHRPAVVSIARRSDSDLATSCTAVSGSMRWSSTCCLISAATPASAPVTSRLRSRGRSGSRSATRLPRVCGSLST